MHQYVAVSSNYNGVKWKREREPQRELTPHKFLCDYNLKGE